MDKEIFEYDGLIVYLFNINNYSYRKQVTGYLSDGSYIDKDKPHSTVSKTSTCILNKC